MSVELLRRDVHPAEVMIGDTVVRDLRVFVTSHRLLAYRATQHGGIDQVLNEPLAQPCSVQANRGTLTGGGRLEAHLADGETAWINRGAGCGCGSPLKSLAPPVPWTAG